VNLQDWSPERPADAFDLGRPGTLNSLLDAYSGTRPDVLRHVLSQAYALGAQSAVLEYRYLDPDYRNEHSRFYSTTFRRYPSITHRLHFFSKPVPPELMSRDEPARFNDLGYLGYTVLRPLPGAPIGRTMLTAPGGGAHVTCLAEDEINLLGEPLRVRAAPFVSQDAQLSICAHATLWMIGYYHHLKFRSPRLLPGDIIAAVPDDIGRGTPSMGLTLYQISVAATRLGLPALVYEVYPDPPPGESLLRIACRYLNSGLPVIVGGDEHAFVLVGYERHNAGQPDERIRFIRHDDEVGPYQLVENYLFDDYAPWEYIVVPLPRKVYMSGEDAEVVGEAHLRQALDDFVSEATSELRRRLDADPPELSFRSTVMSSNEFKTGLQARQVPDELAAIYRRMQMSRWIWVIELVDRELRKTGPCVLAEAIIDATDQLRHEQVLSWRIPGEVASWDPDTSRRSLRALDPK